jgi:hypothetical protein
MRSASQALEQRQKNAVLDALGNLADRLGRIAVTTSENAGTRRA